MNLQVAIGLSRGCFIKRIILVLDEEMTAVLATNQETTVVDSQAIDEQCGIRVAEVNLQTLNVFWIANEECKHHRCGSNQLFQHVSARRHRCRVQHRAARGFGFASDNGCPEIGMNFNTSRITMLIAPVDMRACYEQLSLIAADLFGINVYAGKDFVIFTSHPRKIVKMICADDHCASLLPGV